MRIGFCVSGRGRIMQALLAARDDGLLTFTPAALFLDQESDLADLGKRQGMDIHVVERRAFPSVTAFKTSLTKALLASDVDALFLTFDWLLPKSVVDRFSPDIINLHMGLLPYNRGKRAIDRAVDDGAAFAGVTCHRVDAGMDTGPIIGQAVTPIPQATGSSAEDRQYLVDRVGAHLFALAVPLAVQAMRWQGESRLGQQSVGRVFVSAAQFWEGQFSPALDQDIFEFADRYLSRHFPDLLAD